MTKEIQYKGYTAEPSDYECSDGQLAMSMNLISEDGQLKPLFEPKELFKLPQNCEVIFLHKVQTGNTKQNNYIIYDCDNNKAIYTTDGETYTDIDIELQGEYIERANVIGNTLLLFTEDAVWYVLWKGDAYKVLGNHLPELNMSFGLVGHPRMFSLSDSKKFTFDAPFNQPEQLVLVTDLLDRELKEETQNAITATFMAKVNKFVRQQTVEQGRFCMPFFVRHALRLYDGSLTMYGPPVLMQPSTTAAPVITITDFGKDDGKGNYNNAEKCNVFLVAADLDYQILNPAALNGWSDIISAVEIFVSQPLYNYNQSGKIKYFHEANAATISGKFIGRVAYNGPMNINRYYNDQTDIKAREDCIPFNPEVVAALDGTSATGNYMTTHYAEWYMIDLMKVYFDKKFANTSYLQGHNFDVQFVAELPAFEADTQTEQISNCQNFYKLHTIELDELTDERTLIEVPKDYLQSLVNREHISDDYRTHDTLSAKYAQEYNRRINFAGVKRKLFQGWPLSALLSYKKTDAYTIAMESNAYYSVANSQSAWPPVLHTVYVRVEENTSSYIVKAEDTLTLAPYCGTSPKSHGVWLYYPNAGAKEMWIIGGNASYNIKLEAHPFLNGAYALLSYEEERPDQQLTTPTVSTDLWVSEPQKIYTSEVNNPFVFPVTGINTIGGGDIIGIATAAKALSQGQFGSFPLYAFTTEGVWAMKVSATGTYDAIQPITRDVCTNAEGITQIDSAVLFPTDRGIMLLEGSKATCITDSIATQTPFNILNLPGMDVLHNKIGHTEDNCLTLKPFLDFISGCRMTYDYIHQHIIVYNPQTDENDKPTYTYAYVFSLKAKQWGMMYSQAKKNINAYPNAMVMTHGGEIVSFDDTEQDESKGLFVTRPVKFGEPDVFKTIETIIQRGMFQREDVTTVLYASRDLYNWQLVHSSIDHYLRNMNGTPYKYFRIAGTTTLTEGKSLFGASVSVEPRETIKLK